MENAARLPWVKRLRKPEQCDGIRWSTVALRDIYMHGPGGKVPPRGIKPSSRCSKPAWWRFRPLARYDLSWRYLRDGQARVHRYYCWQHLVCAGMGPMEEQERIRRWLARNPRSREEAISGTEGRG